MDSDEILKAELQKALVECQRLRDENAQLRLRVHQSPDTISPRPQKSSAHDNNKVPSSRPTGHAVPRYAHLLAWHLTAIRRAAPSAT
jgi:hypothetical protein